MFRVASVGKTQLSLGDGIWLGRNTESDMHFVADSSGVVKTRSIRQNIPSRQSSLELLQRITATPWDHTGSKGETDAFILPLCKDDPRPLSEGASFAAEEPVDDCIEPESPLPDDLVDWPVEGSVALPSPPLSPLSRVRRHSEISPENGDFHSRPRLDPAATLERKHEHEPEEAGPGSKIQRLSCVLPVAAVTGIDFPSNSWLFQSLGLMTIEFHLLTPSMDSKFLFQRTKMKRNFC